MLQVANLCAPKTMSLVRVIRPNLITLFCTSVAAHLLLPPAATWYVIWCCPHVFRRGFRLSSNFKRTRIISRVLFCSRGRWIERWRCPCRFGGHPFVTRAEAKTNRDTYTADFPGSYAVRAILIILMQSQPRVMPQITHAQTNRDPENAAGKRSYIYVGGVCVYYVSAATIWLCTISDLHDGKPRARKLY